MMSNFDAVELFQVNQQSVSLGQALTYLQMFGRLNPFVQEVLRDYAIVQGLQADAELVVTQAELSQAIIEFRLRADLTEPEPFQQWLTAQGIEYGTFESQVAIALKIDKLKAKLSQSELDDRFEQQKSELEQVDLYYLVVPDEALVYQIKSQLDEGESFDQVAHQYPLDSEESVIVKREILKRQQLREEIKVSAQTAEPKTLIGPVKMGSRWCLFRIEQVLPAVLEGQLYQDLREQLFEQWVTERLQQLQVSPAVQSVTAESFADSAVETTEDESVMKREEDSASSMSDLEQDPTAQEQGEMVGVG